jgi:anti-sigma B factor antagonist
VADQQTAGNGGDRRIVTLPEHIDIGNARSVAEELEAIFDTGVAVVVADLTGTRTCSAAGVHELDLAHQRAIARDIELRLVIPPGEALRVFALTGHDRWLPIYPDLAAALADPGPALPGRTQQASVGEPGEHALASGVVVIASHVSFDDLAVHSRHAACAQAFEGGVDVRLVDFLDCHVEHPARPGSAAQVRQHGRVVLRRHVLHRVDGHDRVIIRQIRSSPAVAGTKLHMAHC